MKLVYQYMAIFLNFHPLQVISIHYKPVVDGDNGKFRLHKVKQAVTADWLWAALYMMYVCVCVCVCGQLTLCPRL